jgi:hypothetical protein
VLGGVALDEPKATPVSYGTVMATDADKKEDDRRRRERACAIAVVQLTKCKLQVERANSGRKAMNTPELVLLDVIRFRLQSLVVIVWSDDRPMVDSGAGPVDQRDQTQ